MYKADETKFSNVLLIILAIALIGLIIVLDRNIDISMRLRSSFILVIISVIIVSLQLYIFIKSLYYEFTDKHLVIGSSLKWYNIYIEYENILAFDTRVNLINKIGIYAFFGKRFFIGKGNIEGIGKTRLYVTNSKKNIYIMTEKEIYSISPKDLDGFTRELKNRDISHERISRDITEEDVLESDEIAKRFFLLNFILILTVIFVPIIIYYMGYLPAYIPRFSTMNNLSIFIDVNEYLNRVYMTGALSFLFLAVMTLFSRIYSKIDILYHYKILFIPLIVAVFRLLFLLNDLALIYGRI
ncbi:MAG: hypothetical protein GX752_04095 [Clostridium sp.]|nr:hypothetical protein [Clostridium sp.]